MKHKEQEKTKEAICGLTQGHWQEMNRKQRREMTRKIQSEDISLEVIHPDAAGIDIGNESHYVAVPPTRDSQPVRRFGCTTAELKEMAVWLKQWNTWTEERSSTRPNTGNYRSNISSPKPPSLDSKSSKFRRLKRRGSGVSGELHKCSRIGALCAKIGHLTRT
jgi:hypothetical protein